MLLLLFACSERFEGDTADTQVVGADSGDTDTDTDADTDTDTAGPDTDTAGPDTDTGGDTGSTPVPLELCINEFMPDNEAAVLDETLAYPDWIELHNPGDTAVALDGWTLTDFREEPERHVLEGGLIIEPGGFQVLWADATPANGSTHLNFRLASDGGEVGLYAPDGRGSLITYGAVAADFSIARVPDCCEGEGCLDFDFRGTPGVTNVEPVYEDVPILAAGSTWKYLDTGVSPGAGWELPGFDDSAWASGAGPLGFGDTHIVTTISYGPDASNKYVTTWFRGSFDLTDSDLTAITLGLLRDDGAVVYLNGVEVVRDNLPDGTLTDTTLATTSASSETAYGGFDIDVTALVSGTNTLAVEVHQASLDSSDLGFDLTLTGERLVVK